MTLGGGVVLLAQKICGPPDLDLEGHAAPIISVDPEEPNDPDHCAKSNPTGKICPHPNHFNLDDDPTAVI